MRGNTDGTRVGPEVVKIDAAALIDRVIHHADIISIEGQSYRRRAAEESAAARKTKAKR